MSENTALIIKCAKGYKSWGIFAARRYAEKHKLDIRLVRLARQLESVKGFN